MEKKLTRKRKSRFSNRESKKIKAENFLNQKTDEDGVVVFQYEFQKSPWIFKKIKSLFPASNAEELRGSGLKV